MPFAFGWRLKFLTQKRHRPQKGLIFSLPAIPPIAAPPSLMTMTRPKILPLLIQKAYCRRQHPLLLWQPRPHLPRLTQRQNALKSRTQNRWRILWSQKGPTSLVNSITSLQVTWTTLPRAVTFWWFVRPLSLCPAILLTVIWQSYTLRCRSPSEYGSSTSYLAGGTKNTVPFVLTLRILYSTFVGLAVMVILFPAPAWIASLMGDVQKRKMESVSTIDSSLHLPPSYKPPLDWCSRPKRCRGCVIWHVTVQQLLWHKVLVMNVLRMIKLFGWESRVIDDVSTKREDELRWIFKNKMLRLGIDIIKYVFPFLIESCKDTYDHQ